jgi:hypothetical protein
VKVLTEFLVREVNAMNFTPVPFVSSEFRQEEDFCKRVRIVAKSACYFGQSNCLSACSHVSVRLRLDGLR